MRGYEGYDLRPPPYELARPMAVPEGSRPFDSPDMPTEDDLREFGWSEEEITAFRRAPTEGESPFSQIWQ